MSQPSSQENQIRINRYIAEAGVCSRREADQLIFDGMVTVNGRVITDPACRLDRHKDAVKVNGKRIFLQPLTYLLLHKPQGVVSTVEDPEKRPTVIQLLKRMKIRVYPVGRLDFNTSGVLMLTNDGDLALRLTHPRYGFEKTYQAKVQGIPKPQDLLKLSNGVRIPTTPGKFEKTMPARARMIKTRGNHALLEITLREGRQHQVKKMCQAIGHPVEKLARTKFGFLTANGLNPGQWRYLTPGEIKAIKAYQPEPIKNAAEADNPKPAAGRPFKHGSRHGKVAGQHRPETGKRQLTHAKMQRRKGKRKNAD